MSFEQAPGDYKDLENLVQDYLKTGTPEAKENVIREGRVLIDYYAGIYSPGKVDEELKQAAADGFMLALQNYDPARGVLFSNYAAHCIISEIRRALQNRRLFEVPEWITRLQQEVLNATEELAGDNSALPTLEDIAEKLNIAEKGITETMQAGSVPGKEIDYKALKSLRQETFKLPLEDVVTIRKSLDRVSDIKRKVLSLISLNLRELTLAMEEEKSALSETQGRYLQVVENYDTAEAGDDKLEFTIAFPEEYVKEEIWRYFEVLSDEFGLTLADIRFKGEPKVSDDNYIKQALEIKLEGRYRGLLQLLDHLRHREKAIRVDNVRTSRNEKIPARISTILTACTHFRSSARQDAVH